MQSHGTKDPYRDFLTTIFTGIKLNVATRVCLHSIRNLADDLSPRLVVLHQLVRFHNLLER